MLLLLSILSSSPETTTTLSKLSSPEVVDVVHTCKYTRWIAIFDAISAIEFQYEDDL